MMNLNQNGSASRKLGWRWANAVAYRIDLLQPNGHRFVGGWTAVLQAALFVVGYLLTVSSVVAFFAHYIGWSPSLLIAGGAHLALAVFGLSAAPMAEAAEARDESDRDDVNITPILRPQSIRPPAFPPRTRTPSEAVRSPVR